MAAHNIQTKRDIVKVLQYIGETDTVATPANYAVTPTNPDYVAVGKVTDINLQPDIQHNDTDVLGNEDLIDAVKTGELYAFQITFEMADTTLINFGISPSGGTAGSIDESLTFLFSEYLNGVENYTAMTGCRPTSTTVSLERGVWMASMTFICKDISIPNTSAPTAIGSGSYASETSAASITHSGAGAAPFQWLATKHEEGRFSCTVTRGMAIQAVNGVDKILYCKASTRRIDYTVDVFIKTNVLETDWLAKAERVSQYVISTSPDKVLKFTDSVMTSHSRQKTSTNADAFKESITVRAGGVTIAAA